MTDTDERPPVSDPLAPLPEADLDDHDTATPMRTFVGLFLVPLGVVLACVAVFIGFGWIAYDQNTTHDYLNDLRSIWRPRRAQAAYELAKIVIADPAALDEDPTVGLEVRKLFQETDDPQMQRYLALILGHSKDPQAVPLLVESLKDPDSETRIFGLWALGAVGDPRALPPVREALGDADPGIRKTAAYSLGELGYPESAPALRPLLSDAVADVRWNAALALARLGDSAGTDVLRQMLDRQLSAQVPGITPEQQEDAMINAIEALAKVEGASALNLFDQLAETDPSLKVRQAAIQARQAIAPPS